MRLHALSKEIEEAIKAGKLDPSIRKLPFGDAVKKTSTTQGSKQMTSRYSLCFLSELIRRLQIVPVASFLSVFQQRAS